MTTLDPSDYLVYQNVRYERMVALPPVQVEPVPEPTRGKRGYPGQFFVRAAHDDLTIGYARTLGDKIKIAMTNEMVVPRRWYQRDDGEWRVDQFSKISFWPERLMGEWIDYFWSGMSPRQHELFNVSAFGWRDSKATPDELNIYNFILCAGALLEKIGTWREWTLFKAQDTTKPPVVSDIWSDPSRWFVQGVCGHNAAKVSYYGKVNPHQGRLGIPTACPGGVAAVLTSEVREIPPLPFKTTLNGYDVTFIEYCFTGAETLGKTEAGDWFYIEGQAGMLGNQSDMVVHVPGWCKVLPVSVMDWQKV